MSFNTISARNISQYSNASKYRIIDVRNYVEYAKGHIPGVINMPYPILERDMIRLQKTKTYIFYCDRGSTSLLVARKFYSCGYDVLSVVGGFSAYEGPTEKTV